MTRSNKVAADSAMVASSADAGDSHFPKSVNDIPWPAEYLHRFQGLIDAFEDPAAKTPEGMLFVGSHGTGKSTAIRFLMKAIDADCVWINANETDGNVDVKRAIADGSPTSLLGHRHKVLVIDEACSCTPATLKALRGETMTLGMPIILIANDVKAFSAAVQSRCEVFLFDASIADEMKEAQRRRLLELAGTEIPKATVKAITEPHLPDFRVAMRKLDGALRDVAAGREIVLPSANAGAGPLPVRQLTKTQLAQETDALVTELMAIFERYLVLRPGAALVLAIFVLHAYAHDAATKSPVLAVLAPDRDCGKSAVIMLLWCLIETAEQIIDPTGPGLWRRVNEGIPCLMDEADQYLKKDRSDLLTVLNSGFTRGAGSVARYEKSYKCWGIKVIGQIGPIAADTLASRCISIVMDRKKLGEHRDEVTEFLKETFSDLQNRCRAWASAAHTTLLASKPDVPNAINRLADKWRAMLAISDLAGDACGRELRVAMTALEAAQPVQQSIGTELLADIKDAFEARGNEVFLSDDIVSHLSSMPNKDWARRLGRYPQAEIARILRQYRSSDHRDNGGPIVPDRQSQAGGSRRRGYHRHQFDDAFATFVPANNRAVAASTPPQTAVKSIARAAAKPKQTKKSKPTKQSKSARKKAKAKSRK